MTWTQGDAQWRQVMEALDSRQPLDLSRAEAGSKSIAPDHAGQRLLQALQRHEPPKPSTDFADRVLEAWRSNPDTVSIEASEVSRLRPRKGAIWILGALAAAALLLVLVRNSMLMNRPTNHLAPDVAVNNRSTPPMNLAVASAKSATLDLAKETSGPVWRIGQRVVRNSKFSGVSGGLSLTTRVPDGSAIMRRATQYSQETARKFWPR